MTGNKLIELITLLDSQKEEIGKKNITLLPKLNNKDAEVLIEYIKISNKQSDLINILIKVFYKWNQKINTIKEPNEKKVCIKNKEDIQNILINAIHDKSSEPDNNLETKISSLLDLVNNRLDNYQDYRDINFDNDYIKSWIYDLIEKNEFIKYAYETNNVEVISKVEYICSNIKYYPAYDETNFYEDMLHILKLDPSLIEEIQYASDNPFILDNLDDTAEIIKNFNECLALFKLPNLDKQKKERIINAFGALLCIMINYDYKSLEDTPIRGKVAGLIMESTPYLIKYSDNLEELNEFIDSIIKVLSSKNWKQNATNDLLEYSCTVDGYYGMHEWKTIKDKIQAILDFDDEIQYETLNNIEYIYSITKHYKNLQKPYQESFIKIIADNLKKANTRTKIDFVKEICLNNVTNYETFSTEDKDLVLDQISLNKILSAVTSKKEKDLSIEESNQLSRIINKLVGYKAINKSYAKEIINSVFYIDIVVKIINMCYREQPFKELALSTIDRIIEENDNLDINDICEIVDSITLAKDRNTITMLQCVANNFDYVGVGYYPDIASAIHSSNGEYPNFNNIIKYFGDPTILVPEISIEDDDPDHELYYPIAKCKVDMGLILKNYSIKEITRLFKMYHSLNEQEFSENSKITLNYMLKNEGSNNREKKENNKKMLKKEKQDRK